MSPRARRRVELPRGDQQARAGARKPCRSDQISGLARVRTPASGPVPRGNQCSTCGAKRRISGAWRRMSGMRRRAAAQLVVDALHRAPHLLVIGLAHRGSCRRARIATAARGDAGDGEAGEDGNASRGAPVGWRLHSGRNAPDKKTPRPGGQPGRSSQPGPAVRNWPDPEYRASASVYGNSADALLNRRVSRGSGKSRRRCA